MLAGQVTTGGMESDIVTAKAHCDVSGIVLVAEQMTYDVVPRVNVEPDSGVQVDEVIFRMSDEFAAYVT